MYAHRHNLGRYTALALAIAPISAKAQDAIKFTGIEQYPTVAVIGGSVGSAEFSLTCGITPTIGGNVARNPSLDRIVSKVPDGYAQATVIGDKIIVVTPEPGSESSRSIVSVLGTDKSVTAKSFSFPVTVPAYTLPGSGTRVSPPPVSFEYGLNLAGTAGLLCERAVAVNQGNFDTSPAAIANSAAQTPVYVARRQSFLDAIMK